MINLVKYQKYNRWKAASRKFHAHIIRILNTYRLIDLICLKNPVLNFPNFLKLQALNHFLTKKVYSIFNEPGARAWGTGGYNPTFPEESHPSWDNLQFLPSIVDYITLVRCHTKWKAMLFFTSKSSSQNETTILL